MSTRTFALTMAANVTQILPQGRFFMIKSAASALNIIARKRNGQPQEFQNVGAGLQYNALESEKWYELHITSPAVQIVEIVISDEAQVTFSNAVSVTGVATVQEQPFPTFTTPADQVINAATHFDIPANAARRALVVGSLAANAPATTNLRVRDQAATTAAGVEVQPGTSTRIPTNAAVRIRNNDANPQTAWYYEET